MILRAEQVSYRYADGSVALKDVTFEARSGEVVAVLGPNGSGKSTLLMVLAGLLKPSSGRLLLDEKEIVQKSYRKICGIMFQDPGEQLIAPTVWEDVALAPKQLGLTEKEVRRRVEGALSLLGIRELSSKSPHRLSGGQKARVALAGLIAHDPDIYLLDEPGSSLDLDGLNILFELIRVLRSRGKIVVIATQDSDMAAELSDRVYLLRNGEVLSSGDADEVLSNGELLASNGVKPPTAFRIFSQLIPSLLNGPIPVRVDDLVERLKRLVNEGPPVIRRGSSGQR